MSVGRQVNWKGQMRVDVPHMRAMESSIVYDFDTLAGMAMAGGKPYVLKGFKLATWVAGDDPETLQLITADGVIFNYGASENGSMLTVPSNRANEVLSTTNSRVIGAWTASQDNYVAIDFIRLEDSSTSDIVQFIDAVSKAATPKTVPLGRTLDYRIHISTIPFSTNSHLCPIAIVALDGNGNVSTVEDARTMYFRLALGGDAPNPLAPYSWPEGRLPEDPSLFVGGDKAINNEKDWKSAIMHRLWEITGGEYWYSDVTDRNIKFYADYTNTHVRGIYTNNIIWDAGDLTWSGLHILLDNSTAYTNDIDDQTAASPGLTDIADGEVIYVEIDRHNDGAVLTAQKVSMAAYGLLPAPTYPGSRYIVFWREGAEVYHRLDTMAWGRYSGAATTTNYGVVKTNSTNIPLNGPFVVISNTGVNGNAVATGITRGEVADGLGAGTLEIGGSTNDSLIRLASDTEIDFFTATNLPIQEATYKAQKTLQQYAAGDAFYKGNIDVAVNAGRPVVDDTTLTLAFEAFGLTSHLGGTPHTIFELKGTFHPNSNDDALDTLKYIKVDWYEQSLLYPGGHPDPTTVFWVFKKTTYHTLNDRLYDVPNAEDAANDFKFQFVDIVNTTPVAGGVTVGVIVTAYNAFGASATAAYVNDGGSEFSDTLWYAGTSLPSSTSGPLSLSKSGDAYGYCYAYTPNFCTPVSNWVTVTATGGTAPYTSYAWVRTGGAGSPTIRPNAAVRSVYWEGSNGINYVDQTSTWQCTVTDSALATATVSVSVRIHRENNL